MLRSAICQIFLLLAFSKVAPSKSVHHEYHEDSEDYQKPQCEIDADCPKGSFCYKDDNIYSCSPCSQCERYNREKSNIFDCPTKAAQCGDCIAGFHADKDTEGNVVETCLPDQITAKGNDYKNVVLFSILGGIVIISLLLGVLIFVVFKQKRCRKTDGDQSETMSFCPPPSAPPPPYPSVVRGDTMNGLNASQPPFECEIDIKSEGPLSYEGYHAECEIEKPVQAICFKFPNYVSQGPVEQDQEETDGPVQIPNPPDIHDETTQPSDWRPSEETNDERRKDNLGSGPRAALNEEVQTTTVNLENSTEERPFSVISSPAECPSPQSIASISSNVDNNNDSPENRSKKRKIPSPELSSFNFNIYISNTAANLNENNNVAVSASHAQQNGRKRRNDLSLVNDHESD